MQSNLKTLQLFGNRYTQRSSSKTQSLTVKSADDQWKSPLKIMLIFNVIRSSGINNLWKQKSSRPSWTGLLMIISICLYLLAPVADARPAAGGNRPSRHFFQQSSTAGNSYVAQKAAANDANNSSGDTLSLSIFSPLDILRQNMLLEIQRKRIRHAKHRQMQSNKEFLDRIGR